MLLAQLTDTHVVRRGFTYFGHDTARYLSDAIAALNALAPQPDLVAVTGDLVNFGLAAEYDRFAEIVSELRIPYVAIPGNHDDRNRMRERLGGSALARGERVRFALDVGDARVIGLDATGPRFWPGGSLDRASLAWLEETLAYDPERPTFVCVHQPPFPTGLHYLDALGFPGARRFARTIARHPSVGRVVCGHIHCVRSARIGGALALSAPSTAPQTVPELFERRVLAMRHETPGFALHGWTPKEGFRSTVFRRDADGRYAPAAGLEPSGANKRA